MSLVTLTPELIEAFSGTFLSPRYDHPVATPDFHRDAWALYVSPKPLVGCVAPREHAKSTILTMDFILAEVLFRVSDYVIIIGSTEDKAAEQLSNIREELQSNVDIIQEFGIKEFESDGKTEIIVRCVDNHRFRIMARGAEQKIRGSLWKGKRPNLLVCDDMEDDEQVENKERRNKFRRWFFRAARQAVSKNGRISVHGTILHEDSLLSRLCKNKTWHFLFYKAHRSYNDFSDILWPEQWPEDRLRQRRTEFEADNDSAGYSQEFLNTPLDNADAYLLRENFVPMDELDHDKPKVFFIGADFAISKADKANRTSLTIGGQDVDNYLHIVDQRVGRWDSLEIIEQMFRVQERWHPDMWFVEDGQIWKAIEPILLVEMRKRGIWLSYEAITPIKDKAVRGRAYQKRHKARNIKFDKEADWYYDYEDENLKFTGVTEAVLDDQFDSTAILCRGLEGRQVEVEDEDFMTEDEWVMRRQDPRRDAGRSSVTGY